MSLVITTSSIAPRIPPYFFNTDHRQRCLAQLRSKTTGLEKYIYLNGLKERDPDLFYEVLLANMLELVPILYTPTVCLILSWLIEVADTFTGRRCMLKLFAHLETSRGPLHID